MKHIVIFGAGKSATSLIEYLLGQLEENKWQLTLVDNNLSLAQSKLNNAPHAIAKAIDVENADSRAAVIHAADIVISLLPPALHYLIARDCILFQKNLLTASYVDDKINALKDDIINNDLLFLCEMGLDPGIDHMSALQIIHGIQREGGIVTSFKSHCGGLVAPESDNNPWHYKISWNPKNVVLAGKSGATFLESSRIKDMSYEELFDAGRVVDVPEMGLFSWYPNRDSLSYIDVYKLQSAETFIRTTLRHPEFCFGWKNLIDLKLTDEHIRYQTDGMSLQQFFQQHFNKYGFSEWIEKQLTSRFEQTKHLLEKLHELLEAEEEADPEAKDALQDFLMVDNTGDLKNVNLDEIKTKAAATVAGQMHEANLSMKQLFFLGMDDDTTLINLGECSAADVLQFALEKKLALNPDDRDMIVMLHEIEYMIQQKKYALESCLIVKGHDQLHTAMAKTVGLPLGIAAKMILQDRIKLKGLHIPILPEIYNPILAELSELGISFTERILGGAQDDKGLYFD